MEIIYAQNVLKMPNFRMTIFVYATMAILDIIIYFVINAMMKNMDIQDVGIAFTI